MKIVEDTRSAIEIAKDTNQHKRFNLTGGIRIKPGHSLWAYDITTLVLEKVKVQKSKNVNLDGSSDNAKTEFNPNAIYLSALNFKSASRKIQVMYNQQRIESLSQE
jgi:hypothetical protein